MNKFKLAIVSGLLATPALTLAGTVSIPNVSAVPQGIRSFGGFINVFNTFIGWMFTILLILAVVFIIFAAFNYLTAAGNEEKIKKAHSTIIYAVIAIAVAFLAQGVSYVVGELLNTGGAGV